MELTMDTKIQSCLWWLVLTYLVWQNIILCSAQKVNPTPVLETLLWEAGMEEISLYRIPIISYTPQGNLIAAVEARKNAGTDAGPKFLAVRRSSDGGYNWTPQQFILDDGAVVDGLNLGVIIVDDITKSIFIFYSVCFHLQSCTTATTYYVKSIDDGVTWQQSVNVSEQIGTATFAPGPGYGIQKRYAPNKGRLIVCGHRNVNLQGDGVFCLLSDDHGRTWSYGGALFSIPYGTARVSGDFTPDECQPIELPDGSIVLNIRNQDHFHCQCRMVARSLDGAMTFPVNYLTFDTGLNDSAVAAGLLYHNGVMYFTNPNSLISRSNLTLKWSYNNGTTWSGSLQIWSKASSYSSMTAVPGNVSSDNHIFVIYEKGLSSPDSISLVRLTLYGGI